MTQPLLSRSATLKPARLQARIVHHLQVAVGKDAAHATRRDWRMALSLAVREEVTAAWFDATRQTYEAGAKRVYYLSMEFLIGRLLGDALVNLDLMGVARKALRRQGLDLDDLLEDEPDAALGNGGLGRLAACFLDSLSSLRCPAYGYGIRYEHGLFKQSFADGQQVETPEDWLSEPHPWEFPRPEAAYTIGFGGSVSHAGARAIWHPAEQVVARAHDTPIVGWQGQWANTLRLWEARPTKVLDLARFNQGDYAGAAQGEALARSLSRVLYPDDSTMAGQDLRLKQEFFMTSAALQDILRRFQSETTDWADLPDRVAIQLNDTHPAIAGPELMRLLVDVHGLDWAR
ncbi:MAG: glycogen/starch/alpha-glucan phosphorylase, partial [Primorskyibacter sp.]